MGSEEREAAIFHSCCRLEALSLFGGWGLPSGGSCIDMVSVIMHIVVIDDEKGNVV